MRFKTWFRRWFLSILMLMSAPFGRYKSESAKEKAREVRRARKQKNPNLHRVFRRRKRRRTSHEAANARMISALLRFCALTLSVIFIPIGILDFGFKKIKSKKRAASNDVKRTASRGQNKNDYQASPNNTAAHSKTTIRNTVNAQNTERDGGENENSISGNPHPKRHPQPKLSDEVNTVVDKNAPKTAPKNESDSFIRKSMVIESICDSSLSVGKPVIFSLDDDGRIGLLYEEKTVGFLPEDSKTAIETCLNLGMKIYGIVSAVLVDDGVVKYELEAWIDNS